MAIDKNFITAGKAFFTIECPQKPGCTHAPHYTYKVSRKPAQDGWPEAYFVKLLTGPDNYSNYTYLGKLNPHNGTVQLTGKSAYPADSYPVKLLQRVLACIWAGNHAAYEQHGFRTHHAGKCGRCGKKLTVPASVESGYGPECIHLLSVA